MITWVAFLEGIGDDPVAQCEFASLMWSIVAKNVAVGVKHADYDVVGLDRQIPIFATCEENEKWLS